MGVEFGFPLGFWTSFCVGRNFQLSPVRSSTVKLLRGLGVTYLFLKGLNEKAGVWKAVEETRDGSFIVKSRRFEGFGGGCCRVRRGADSSVLWGRGHVVGRSRRRRLKAAGDRTGNGKGLESGKGRLEGDGVSMRDMAGQGGARESGGEGAGSGGMPGEGGVGSLLSKDSPAKVLAKHIKAADGVVKGVKAAKSVLEGLETPVRGTTFMEFVNPGVLVIGLKAAEMVVKVVKVSKGVASALKASSIRFRGREDYVGAGGLSERFQVLVVMVKKMKAPAAALKIVKITRSVGKGLGESGVSELLNWTTLEKGYKLSKSVLTVCEVLTSLKGGMISMVVKGLVGMKGAVDGTGVMIKAFWLSREAYVLIIKGVGVSRGAWQAFIAISGNRPALESSQAAAPGTVDVSSAVHFQKDKTLFQSFPLRAARLREEDAHVFKPGHLSDCSCILSSFPVASSFSELQASHSCMDSCSSRLLSMAFPLHDHVPIRPH